MMMVMMTMMTMMMMTIVYNASDVDDADEKSNPDGRCCIDKRQGRQSCRGKPFRNIWLLYNYYFCDLCAIINQKPSVACYSDGSDPQSVKI